MIYFRIPETVCLLQIDCTNHNSPFFTYKSRFIDPFGSILSHSRKEYKNSRGCATYKPQQRKLL